MARNIKNKTVYRKIFGSLIVILVALCGGLVVSPIASAAPEEATSVILDDKDTVSADALPAPQMDGVVWRQVVAGSTVYAVGEFTKARPSGAAVGKQEVARKNILAYNIDTGELLPFAPNVNNQIVDAAVSPDGKTLYIAGSFTSIDGSSRYRVAAFDTGTGTLTPWRPVLNARASAITVTASAVYIGGIFTTVNKQDRTRLVGVDTTTGTTNTALNATIPDGDIRGVQVSPDGSTVVIGGSFTSVNGSNKPGYGLARLNSATSESLPFPANDLIRNGGTSSAIYGLKSDNDGVYAVGYSFLSSSSFEGAFRTDWEGNIVWVDSCRGDTYDIWPDGDVVYQASHKHNCSPLGNLPQTNPWTYHHASANTNYATGFNVSGVYAGPPAPTMYAFRPEFQNGTYTAAKQAVWGVTGTDDYILYAGEFKQVNGTPQQGIVRFAHRDAAPNKQGPMFSGAASTPTLDVISGTGLRVNIPGNYDRDDYQLRYTVFRNDTNTVIYDAMRDSRWYDLSPFSIVDTSATPGQQARYRVRVMDPQGNTTNSNWASAVAPAAASVNNVASKILTDEPVHYWRLNESEGTSSSDWASTANLTVNGTTRAVVGVNGSKATRFAGASASYASSSILEQARDTLSIEAWFKTSQKGGGKILGFGNSSTGNSSIVDRHLYIDKDNYLKFGVRSGSNLAVRSNSKVNDGKWHHAVGTLDGTVMRLYVDGQLVSERTDMTARRVFTGYWRVGGDTSWSGNANFNGDISDAAVYSKALTADQVASHFNAGVPQPPTADYTASSQGLKVSFDASPSLGINAAIASYAWDFGDGKIATGAKPSHDYARAGTYNVKLTVTDDLGATGTVTKPIEVSEVVNSAPVAEFSSNASGLSVAFDGSSSSDADGSIASYTWDFGDGTAGTGAMVPHEYATEGTYTVKLTVTDDRGATGVDTKDVTVAESVSTVLAEDLFNRLVSNGWGSADLGGAWTVGAGSPSRYSVASGVGQQVLHAGGASTQMNLQGVESVSTDLRFEVSVDKLPSANLFVYGVVRKVGGSEYAGRVTVQPNGGVAVHVLRNGALASGGVVSGLQVAAGGKLNVAVQAEGTAPTVVRVKVWKAGTTEPVGWQYALTDSTGDLQEPGGIALKSYVSGSASNVPIVVSFSNVWAGVAGTAPAN